MEESNKRILENSPAKFKLLLDANVVSYAMRAEKEIGINLLDYINGTKHIVDWFIGSNVALSLANNKITPGITTKILNCNSPPVKMDSFPYQKSDGEIIALRLNKLAGDDWAQILLAMQHKDLIIVTNDSAMFKTAHAILGGRALAFHELLKQMSEIWFPDKRWLKLKLWLDDNVNALRRGTSWTIPK